MSKIPKIYIDGREGTTGLQIYERLGARGDIELLIADERRRKDVSERKKLINEADIVFLCLPDEAARESVALCDNETTRIIDASTAHRVAPGWEYGFPELSAERRKVIASSKRVANPGCYATGMLAITAPLVAAKLLPRNYPLSIHAVSGYSGAGKSAIAQYTDSNRDGALESPRQYALAQAHKHLPEMQKYANLESAPIFNPYICDFYAGMTVSIPLHTRLLRKGTDKKAVLDALAEHYSDESFIEVEHAPESGFIPATGNTGTNMLTIFVCGDNERITVVSLLDNLGKGASGAAVQNMNIMLGFPEDRGLQLP